MIRLRSSALKLDTFFVVMLLILFALTTFMLVLLGVRQYKTTAETMNQNYETRTAASYLKEKVRQADKASSIYVSSFFDTPALTITTANNDTTYYTYIYFYDGYLRELFVREDSVFSLESGQKIVPVLGLSIENISSDLVKAVITDSSGKDISVYLSVKSSVQISTERIE